MDTKRYYGEGYFQKLYETLAEKYRRERFDVVIVADNDAFEFVRRRYNQELFRSLPVVFCGINNYKDSMLAGFDRFTGVVEDTDVNSTIEIALKLHPMAKRFVVVGDRTTTGVAMKNEVLEVMPRFKDRIKFVFLEDFDIGELLTNVRELPRDSLILLTVVNRDRTGNFFAYEESLDLMYREANVPIYSFWDFYLNGGIVGGMLTSAFQQGKSAAGMALRILRGEDVSAIPVVKKSPNLYMFDYRQLARFGIKPSALPAESIVINKPDTFYSRYKNIILAGSATIFVLSLVIIVLLVNISLRKQYETALKDSEEKYRDLYDHAPDMYHSINEKGVIIDCNETEAKMLGYRKREIIGRRIADFLTEESRKTYEKEFSTLKEHRELFGLEREFVRKDGTTFPAALNVFIELDENGELSRTKTIGRDMTERKRVEMELRRSREDLRSLSAHLQSAREEERGHIAREIHDELGQILSKLKLDIAWLKKRLSRDQIQLAEKADKMSGLVDSTIRTVQRISSELRPAVLDYLGLPAAIEWQAKEFKEQTGIGCAISIEPELAVPDQNISIAVFRIFQETLTNIIRHSKASRVDVHLKKDDTTLMLEIRDNGAGIPQEKVSDHASFGLMGMKERARFLGGSVTVAGVPGKGTTVTLKIPLVGKENG
jgi:PAS domain S-box-containing protein